MTMRDLIERLNERALEIRALKGENESLRERNAVLEQHNVQLQAQLNVATDALDRTAHELAGR